MLGGTSKNLQKIQFDIETQYLHKPKLFILSTQVKPLDYGGQFIPEILNIYDKYLVGNTAVRPCIHLWFSSNKQAFQDIVRTTITT